MSHVLEHSIVSADTRPNRRVRVAIYVWISSDRSGAGLGVARQRKTAAPCASGWAGTSYACTATTTYRLTQASRTRKWNQLLADIAAGLIDAVACWHVDRLTRSPRDLEDVINLHDKRGRIMPATVTGEMDLSTPTGRMLGAIQARGRAGQSAPATSPRRLPAPGLPGHRAPHLCHRDHPGSQDHPRRPAMPHPRPSRRHRDGPAASTASAARASAASWSRMNRRRPSVRHDDTGSGGGRPEARQRATSRRRPPKPGQRSDTLRNRRGAARPGPGPLNGRGRAAITMARTAPALNGRCRARPRRGGPRSPLRERASAGRGNYGALTASRARSAVATTWSGGVPAGFQ
jgi:Resolvase, N terminal domain